MSDLVRPYEAVNSSVSSIDTDFFTSSTNKLYINSDTTEEPTKRRGRPKKNKEENGYVGKSDRELSAAETNEPYIRQYDETNNMLKGAIYQADALNRDIVEEISKIKESKTLKRKYDYIAQLSSTSGSLLSTKINAIRELNKTITDCNNMEIKRIKELNLNNQVNDDEQIMNMYNAFVNAPINTGGAIPLGPSMIDTTMMGGTTAGFTTFNDSSSQQEMSGFSNYMSNLTPEQNRMRLENNPNVKTVVVFNQATGDRYFDVIDTSTGASIPNYTRPDSFLLNDTHININAGVAVNNNIASKWDLIIIGNETLNRY